MIGGDRGVSPSLFLLFSLAKKEENDFLEKLQELVRRLSLFCGMCIVAILGGSPPPVSHQSRTQPFFFRI